MAIQIALQMNNGRILHGITYTTDPATLPLDPAAAALAQAMQGGYAYGSYRLQDSNGWVYPRANTVSQILNWTQGAAT